nr:hypothetical protein [Tanacetum cinerariifolium]
MSDSEDSTVTYTTVSSPYEGRSGDVSPGVDGPPVMPEDPYAYVVAAFQALPPPDYVPSLEEPEQAPPSLVYILYVPKPVYPEYIPPEDDVFPAEEQPLPTAASPTAESPGYIPESDSDEDLEEDDDEDPEEDPADYLADHDDEEEEHPTSADSIPPLPALRVTARRVSIIHCPGYKAGESSVATAARPIEEDIRYGIKDNWIDPRDVAKEEALTTLEGVNTRGRQTEIFQRVEALVDDSQYHYETGRLVDQEARCSREAWGHSIGLSSIVHFELQGGSVSTRYKGYIAGYVLGCHTKVMAALCFGNFTGPHDTQYCMENPEQAFFEYASTLIDEVGDAKISKFEADFKQYQSEVTNKLDAFLKAFNNQMTGVLPSDSVKNSKLNPNLTSSAHSYPTGDPQSSSNSFKSANAIQTCFKSSINGQKNQLQVNTLTANEIETLTTREPEYTLENEFVDLHLNVPVLEVLAHVLIYETLLDKYILSLELWKNRAEYIQSVALEKMKDLRLFILPCRLRDSKPFETLADLGSCVNLLPLNLFKKLKIGLLEEIDDVIGLADGTKSYPEGIMKNVEVHVGKLKLF